jgi:predicted Zn finger-like uncharacterized protein
VKNNKVENKTLYTRCPSCSTAFKVTDKLLSMADGKVRCGACLAIFQATDYMLEPSKSPKKTYQQIVTEQQQAQKLLDPQQTNETAVIDVQQDLLNKQPSAEEPMEEVGAKIDLSTEQSQKRQSDLVQEKSDEVVDASIEDDININSDIDLEGDFDQSEFDDLGLDSIDLQAPDFQEPDLQDAGFKGSDFKDSGDFKDSEIADLAIEDLEINEPLTSKHDAAEQDSSEQNNLAAIEPDAEQVDVVEPIDDQSFDIQEQPDQSLSAIDGESNNLDEFAELQESEPADELDFHDETDFHEEMDFQDESNQSDVPSPFDDLDSEPDPLDEFNNIVEENNNSLKMKLALALVLVLLIIAFTSIWTNRQAIAWSESWGSSMTSVCRYLPCDLMPRRDVAKIKLLQRQFAPNEELENVLDVKVLLVNKAVFAQPYPTIKITFSNKNGDQVSVKSFTPADYLDAGSVDDLMPSDSEVHIHFKTEVSHPDALGFEFTFE